MVNGINPSMSKWFEKCEKDKENLTPEKAKAYADENGENHADLEARSKELFALLCMLTDGEAKTIIRGQSDVLVAYQLIHKTYSRITLAKTIRTIREALVPKRAGHIGETILKISEWECKVSELEKLESSYALQPMMKLTFLTEICPEEIKDMIYQYQNIDANTQDPNLYKTIKDKGTSWVSNRVDSNQATSMDIGALTDEWGVEWDTEAYDCQPC